MPARRWKSRMPKQPSITCPHCGKTSYHPEDIKYRYCGACYRFHEGSGPSTFGHDDIYCAKCDVFGHAEGSPYCEFYYARWEAS